MKSLLSFPIARAAAAVLAIFLGAVSIAARPPHSPTPVHVLTVSGAAGAKANS